MKKVGWCMGYFNCFHSIRGHRYLNEKPFFPNSSSFPAILGFWGLFQGSREKISDFKKLRLYLLLYSKRTSQSPVFNAKIGLKNGPPWAAIFAKMLLNMARQTKPQSNYAFSQISQHRVSHFYNQFLCWNLEVKMVVMSTVKGTRGITQEWQVAGTSKVKGKFSCPKCYFLLYF